MRCRNHRTDRNLLEAVVSGAGWEFTSIVARPAWQVRPAPKHRHTFGLSNDLTGSRGAEKRHDSCPDRPGEVQWAGIMTDHYAGVEEHTERLRHVEDADEISDVHACEFVPDPGVARGAGDGYAMARQREGAGGVGIVSEGPTAEMVIAEKVPCSSGKEDDVDATGLQAVDGDRRKLDAPGGFTQVHDFVRNGPVSTMSRRIEESGRFVSIETARDGVFQARNGLVEHSDLAGGRGDEQPVSRVEVRDEDTVEPPAQQLGPGTGNRAKPGGGCSLKERSIVDFQYLVDSREEPDKRCAGATHEPRHAGIRALVPNPGQERRGRDDVAERGELYHKNPFLLRHAWDDNRWLGPDTHGSDCNSSLMAPGIGQSAARDGWPTRHYLSQRGGPDFEVSQDTLPHRFPLSGSTGI